MPKKLNNEIVYLEIEKSRIEREKSRLVLDESLSLYLLFMIVGVVGFAFKYLDQLLLNAIIIVGIFILILGTVPYLVVISKEENKIKRYLEELKK